MSNQDKLNSYLTYIQARSRVPGKRQIKLNPIVLEDFVNEDDELGSDPPVSYSDSGSSVSDEEGDSDESGSEGSSSDEDEDEEKSSHASNDGENEGQNGDVSDYDEGLLAFEDPTGNPSTEEDMQPIHSGIKKADVKPICAICLNERKPEHSGEIITCDLCKVTVHDGCYVPLTREEAVPPDSAETSEPWFCEPCLHNGKWIAPYCELCPSRHGAFKRCENPGSYVHVICASYTPRITYGDPDHLTAVSLQDIDKFGRKSCSSCLDPISAHTGISTECEAGMCKEFFHITCAQRLGLLVNGIDNSVDSVADVRPLYLFCNKHSNPEDVKKKKRAYEKWIINEKIRFARPIHKLTPHEENFRQLELEHFTKVMNSFVGISITRLGDGDGTANEAETCILKSRNCRSICTSPKALDLFREKSKMFEDDGDKFDQKLSNAEGSKLSFLALGCSSQFFQYIENRENGIHFDERKLKKMTSDMAELKARGMCMREENAKLNTELEAIRDRKQELVEQCRELQNLLAKEGILDSLPPKLQKILHSPAEKSNSSTKRKSNGTRSVVNTCAECHEDTEQHLMIECDECHLFYHLACLDPPLKRHPRKLNCLWVCHECSESDKEEELIVNGPRHSKQRKKSTSLAPSPRSTHEMSLDSRRTMDVESPSYRSSRRSNDASSSTKQSSPRRSIVKRNSDLRRSMRPDAEASRITSPSPSHKRNRLNSS